MVRIVCHVVQAQKGSPVKMIYIQPLHHNPTGTNMSRARAEALLQLAARFGAMIMCDEPYEVR